MLKNQKVWLPQCAEFTDRDQIAVEREVERQMEDVYYRSISVEFSSSLDMDSRCPWRLFVMDGLEDKLRLNVVIPGHTPKEKVLDMVHSGRFDRYVPEYVEEWYWWIEKW